MNFGWLQSLLYGFIMGLAEILPVSAPAHRALMLKMFGIKDEGAIFSLLIHFAILLAVYFSCRIQISQIQRQLKIAQIPHRRRRREPDMQKVLDMRLMKTTIIPIVLGFLLYPKVSGWRSNLGIISGMLLINGLILYIPQFLRSGNKDSRTMSRLDSIVIGFFGALGVVPGISRIGAMNSAAHSRGADRNQALLWSLMLSIPVLACWIGFDVYQLVTLGMDGASLMLIIRSIIAAATAFGGAVCGITAMRAMAASTGYAGFAYYSWGAALFSLILYLTT